MGTMLDRLRLALRLLPAAPKLAAHKPDGRYTAADRVEEQARRRGDETFLLFEDRRLSYAEFNAAANRIAHWAEGLGLGKDDVVALVMENRPEYICTWAGLAKLGVTTALINTNLTGRALAHCLDTAGARHVIFGRELLDSWASLGDALERPLRLWVQGDGDGALPEDARDLDAVLAEQSEENPDPAVREELRAGDMLFYIYTSGTTGLPKAARFSHLRFLGAGDVNAVVIGLEPDDVYYCALPLYHTAGGVLVISSALAAGACVGLRRRFSASAFWDDIRRFDATCFQYIGEFCRYLMNQPEKPTDREHRVRVACGNGLRPDIWEGFQKRFGIENIREFYGATEGNAALMNLENKVGSVGRYPFKFLNNARLIRFDVEKEEHLRDERGFCIECKPHEVGEYVGKIPARNDRAQGRFEGYTSKEATDKKILRDVFEKGDAWFRTGDLLRYDEDDFFYFVDRIGDTFRWKGENVSTQEVAEILGGFPAFAMVNVYGVEVPGADGRAGMAAVRLREGTELDGEELYGFVDAGLARYAAPVFVRVLEELEITGTFKLRKVDVQRQGYDVEQLSDSIWLRDDDAGRYVPLTPEILAEIRGGGRKI